MSGNGANGGSASHELDATRTAVWQFAQYSLDARTRELRKNGLRIRLAEKPFLVLVALLEKPGELVTREELHKKLWAGETFVDFDNNLNTAVASLRSLLSDSARSPRYIETLPRLGYRFISTVDCHGEEPAAPPHDGARASPVRPASSRWSRALLAAAVVLLATAGAWVGLGHLPLNDSSANGNQPASHAAAPPGSPDYVNGMYLLKRGDAESLKNAAELLSRAAEAEPLYAPAHAAFAEASMQMGMKGLAPREVAFAQAEPAARRALEIDPSLASPHRTLAVVHLFRDWGFAAAAGEVQRALAADPQDAESHIVSAMVHAAAGQSEQAVTAARRAIQLDPGSARVRADLAYFLLAAGRLQESVEESRQVLAVQPDLPAALDSLLLASERLGRFAAAQPAAVRLMELARATPTELAAVKEADPAAAMRSYHEWQIHRMESTAARRSWPAIVMAEIYAGAGRTDQSLEWLERSYRAREARLVFLVASPDLATLRNDPRFIDLARRVGVPLPPHS